MLIQVVVEMMEALPGCERYEVRLNHLALLEAVLGHVKLPKELQSSALALLSTAASQSPLSGTARASLWQSIRCEMATSLKLKCRLLQEACWLQERPSSKQLRLAGQPARLHDLAAVSGPCLTFLAAFC